MGSRGPTPKRTTEVRRRNKKTVDTPASRASDPVDRKPNSKWHPVAKRWFESLGNSGQSVFYEESDWATAYLIAESISRELGLQVVGVTKEGAPIKAHVPPKGASLSAWLKAMTGLMVTEGDRRRAAVELTTSKPSGSEGAADVYDLDVYRERIARESS